MLDRIDTTSKPARIRYMPADFRVLSPGQHVVCAVTGKQIPLDELRYWNWERQEAYIDHLASFQAEMTARKAEAEGDEAAD